MRSEPRNNLAVLLAKSSTDKTKIKALRAELKSVSANLTLKQSGQTKPKLGKAQNCAKYSQEDQYGPGKYFESRVEFFDCLNLEPANGKKQKKNDIWWHFCFSCGRNSMHKSIDCPKLSSNKGRVGAKSYVASLHKPSKSCDDEVSKNSDSNSYDSVESFKT